MPDLNLMSQAQRLSLTDTLREAMTELRKDVQLESDSDDDDDDDDWIDGGGGAAFSPHSDDGDYAW